MYLTGEDNLVKRLKNKDEAALDEVMKQYLPLISSVIYNIGRNILTAEDIEEACMDTFVALWKNTDKIHNGSLKGYICAIAKSKAFDKLDSVKKEKTTDAGIDEYEEEDDFSVEVSIEEKEANAILADVIDSLGKPDSEIVLRYYYYYQRIGEIAKALNMTEDNVKVRLHRARGKIKKLLDTGGYTI